MTSHYERDDDDEPEPTPTPAPTPVVPPPPPAPSVPVTPSIGYDITGSSARFPTPQIKPRYHYNAWPVRRDGSLWAWELTQYSLNGGLGKQDGDYDRDFDRSGASTLWVDDRTVCLPPLTTTTATPDPTGSLTGIHHARIFSTLMIGLGAGDDVSLYREASATDPTPTAVTGIGTAGRDNTGGITCIVPAVMGGATAARGAVIGRASAAPRYVTDSSGTIGAVGHANLNPCFGAIQTFRNDDTILFLANNGLWSLNKTQAISAAPTQIRTNWPNGGFALGLQKLAGGPYNVVRAYWALPLQTTAAGALTFGSEGPFTIVHTNDEGGDPQVMDFLPYFSSVTGAWVFRDGILATDGQRWVFHNGAEVRDLYAFDERPADSNRDYRIRGPWIIGHDLYQEVNEIAGTSGTGATIRWIEKFDFDNWAWNNASAHQTLSATGSFGVLPGTGGLPWSDQTRYMFTYSDGSWRYMQWPNPGVNLFGYRKTSGSAAATGRQFSNVGLDSTLGGTHTAPSLELPRLEGMTKTIAEVIYMGRNADIGTPTTSGTVAFTLSDGQSRAFSPRSDGFAQNWLPGPNLFDKLQLDITITQQTGGIDPTRTTPNAVPYNLRGWAWPSHLPQPAEFPMLPGHAEGITA